MPVNYSYKKNPYNENLNDFYINKPDQSLGISYNEKGNIVFNSVGSFNPSSDQRDVYIFSIDDESILFDYFSELYDNLNLLNQNNRYDVILYSDDDSKETYMKSELKLISLGTEILLVFRENIGNPCLGFSLEIAQSEHSRNVPYNGAISAFYYSLNEALNNNLIQMDEVTVSSSEALVKKEAL